MPFSPLADKCVYGNVLLAGDAATQNLKPLVEGILPSAICGDLAGKTAADHVKSSGVSLSEYPLRVHKKMGLIFDDSEKYIDMLSRIGDISDRVKYLLLLGLTSNVFSLDDADRLKDQSFSVVEKELNSWNNSWFKRFKTEWYERIGILYLRLASK